MIKIRVIRYLLVFIMFFSASCSFDDSMILERKDTQFFEVEEMKNDDGGLKLIISGLAFHSSMSVSEITSSILGEKILVIVNLQAATKGGSGRFKYEIIIPTSVSEVVFGKSQETIWSRKETIGG